MPQTTNPSRPFMPEGGWCLNKTRRRIVYLLWGLLFMFIAFALATYFCMTLLEGGSGDEYWVGVVVSGCLGVAALLGGVYECYVSIRDAFFPGKSTLAKSIRSQLPYPEENPDWRKLFDMVDRDIDENGIWFDNVAVGHQWVLGDEASHLSRVRAVFDRYEVQHHHSKNRNTTTVIIQIYIVDNRRQCQMTALKDKNELEMLVNCLKLRAPDALFLPYRQYLDFMGKSEEAWNTVEREYQIRAAARKTQETLDAAKHAAIIEQNMILRLPDGSVTSRVTDELVRDTLNAALMQVEAHFTLTSSRPIEARGRRYALMQCVVLGLEDADLDEQDRRDEAEIYLMLAEAPNMGEVPSTGFLLQCSADEAEKNLLDWLHGQAPDVSGWVPANLRTLPSQEQRETKNHAKLILISSTGTRQGHERFHREDVEIASVGLADGSYRQVELTLPNGYLWMMVHVEDFAARECTITATRPEGQKLLYLQSKCTPTQASRMLLDYFDGKFLPQGGEWKDVTRKMTKQ